MLDLSHARNRMVEVHLSRRGIHGREVLDAMREVPREKFVDPGFEEFAYEDGAAADRRRARRSRSPTSSR